MRETDLNLLIRAARGAGEIAARHFERGAKQWEKPDGAGPVTEADLEVNELLADVLQDARPMYGWLSEETEDDPVRLERRSVFIVDPIDGTRSFIEGSKTWAHALAVAEKGVITAAVVYLPLRKKIYTASAGGGAHLNGEAIRVSQRVALTGASLLAAKPNFKAEYWRNDVPEVKSSYRPSLAYRLAVVAEGRFDAMMTLRPSWEWDIAAGDLILREAGAATSDRRANALRFNSAIPKLNGVIAANPVLHREINQALAPEV